MTVKALSVVMVFTVLSVIGSPIQAAVKIESTFDTDAEGWTVLGGSAFWESDAGRNGTGDGGCDFRTLTLETNVFELQVNSMVI